MVSRRGSNTVAARCVPRVSFRKRAYSAPHSAAGRSAKSRMVVLPRTSMPLGRMRTTVTSRLRSPTSIPTPEPKARNLFMSADLWGPGILVPAQDLNGGVVTGGHKLHRGGGAAAEVGKLIVGQAHSRGRTQRENGIAAHTNVAAAREAGSLLRIYERLYAPPRHDCSYGLRRNTGG